MLHNHRINSGYTCTRMAKKKHAIASEYFNCLDRSQPLKKTDRQWWKIQSDSS